MSTNLSTHVKNIRTRMSEVADSREATDAEFMRFAELRDWYRAVILSEAVVVVYGDSYPSVEQLMAGWQASGARLERAEKLTAEAWQLILQRAGIEEREEKFAPNTARVVAFTTPKLEKAIQSEAHDWTPTGSVTAPYRGELASALIEAVARGLNRALIAGTEAVISGRFSRYPVMDLALIADFVRHLHALPEAAKTAERKELGVRASVLHAEAGDAMDVLRFGELDKTPEDWQVERTAKGKRKKWNGNVTRAQRDAVRRLAILERELMLDNAKRAERDRLRTEVGDLLSMRNMNRYGDETPEIATMDFTVEAAVVAVENPWQTVADLLGVRNGEEAQAAIAYAKGMMTDGVTSLAGADLQQPESAEEVKSMRRRVTRAASRVDALMPQIQRVLSALVAA